MSPDHDKQDQRNLQLEADRVKPPSKTPVLVYILILFIAAFLLLVVSYFMQQRNNAEMISGLKESASALQSIENLQAEKDDLANQVAALEEQNELLTDMNREQNETITSLTDHLSQTEKEAMAVDWLRQIQTLYAMKYYKAARALITEFQESGLDSYLPTESVVSDRGSPAEDYATILDVLY